MYDPGLDIIVVSYRSSIDLNRFLGSYEQFRPRIPHTLHVFNVAPLEDDLLVAQAARTSLGAHHYVENANCGYGKAVNFAASRGNREALVAFNADVRLTEDSVDRCFEALMERPEVAILGPRQLNSQGEITHAGIFGTNVQPSRRGWKQPDRPEFWDTRDDAVSVSGSAYFVKRSAWNELMTCPIYQEFDPAAKGAFLEPKGLFYEDMMCSVHARSHGLKVLYFGSGPHIFHEWHQAVERANRTGDGYSDLSAQKSLELYREFCNLHGIDHE